jgi:hypothetical protein
MKTYTERKKGGNLQTSSGKPAGWNTLGTTREGGLAKQGDFLQIRVIAIPEQAAFYVREAARYLGISLNTLRKRADAGLFAARRDENGNRVFLLRDLDRYLECLPVYESRGNPFTNRPVKAGRTRKGGKT